MRYSLESFQYKMIALKSRITFGTLVLMVCHVVRSMEFCQCINQYNSQITLYIVHESVHYKHATLSHGTSLVTDNTKYDLIKSNTVSVNRRFTLTNITISLTSRKQSITIVLTSR